MNFNKFMPIYLMSMLFMVISLISLLLLSLSKFSKIYISFKLINLNVCNLDLVFMMDFYCLLFMMTVGLISLSVLLFSNEYMVNEKFFSRFHSILMSFVVSMLLLILSPNLISALIGWDGLGVSSFILVIYYSSMKSFNAGFITALTNRLGDGLLIWAVVMLFSFGDFNIFWYSLMMKNKIIIFCLILGSFTKSAQIPFCAWLPAAMAAPTPVSSLVHSSTLVTAGVYLLIRHSNWVLSASNLLIFSFLGSLTTLMASLSAFFESDMKKMVALSTLSQVGVMVVALGVGNWTMAFFHLITHAFFKALLFISTGNLIHSSNGYQALKMSGALSNSLPISYSANLICSMSLCGLPFMSAFYSKEPIIEISNEVGAGALIYLIMFIGIFMTVAYSVRLIMLTGVMTFQGNKNLAIDENLIFTSLGMILLFPGAIFGGTLATKWFSSSPLFFYSSLELKISMLSMLILGIFLGNLLTKIKIVSSFFLTQIFSMWSLPWISAPAAMNLNLLMLPSIKRQEMNWFWGMAKILFFLQANKMEMVNLPSWNLPKFLIFLMIGWVTFYLWCQRNILTS